jgi:hypothetical protein
MEFTSELYNYSLKSSKEFVSKWIVNECIEMVSGLEDLLNKNQKHEVVNSFFHEDLTTTLMGIELINFKGERISGALSFLEKVKRLTIFSSEIPSLIERVLNCNLTIYSDLKIEIKKLIKNIAEYRKEKEKLYPKWNKLKTELETFKLKKTLYLDEFKAANPEVKITKELNSTLDKYFNDKYPKYSLVINEFNPLDREYNSILRRIHIAEKWQEKFCSYVDVIERHFKSINRSIFESKQA